MLVVFFFKQKTAYEMRISDWSSDVCSSDLREMENRYRSMSTFGVRNIGGFNARLEEARKKGEILTRRVQTGFDPDTGKPVFEEQTLDMTEIGRASCRERVCQYV